MYINVFGKKTQVGKKEVLVCLNEDEGSQKEVKHTGSEFFFYIFFFRKRFIIRFINKVVD